MLRLVDPQLDELVLVILLIGFRGEHLKVLDSLDFFGEQALFLLLLRPLFLERGNHLLLQLKAYFFLLLDVNSLGSVLGPALGHPVLQPGHRFRLLLRDERLRAQGGNKLVGVHREAHLVEGAVSWPLLRLQLHFDVVILGYEGLLVDAEPGAVRGLVHLGQK
uniref:Uncharacterized protein n=1 Tax=Strombidium inclinatum TaxID=197538 RepID=A0A7S3N074_9SPIT